jgi:predicted RNA-binding Zn ribbon-like protein
MSGASSSSGTASRRQPAPGGLELVRTFLNSSDIEAGTDDLTTAAGVEAWLRAHDVAVPADGVDPADRARVVAFREDLRDLITCRAHGEMADAPLAELARAGRSSPLTVAFGADGGAILRADGAGVTGLIGRILGEVALGAVAGTWPRLKVCRNDACRWAYYDASRNRSGIWCSMAICGNRAKGRALRVRRGGSSRSGSGAPARADSRVQDRVGDGVRPGS